MVPSRPSLRALISVPVVVFALVAMLLQGGLVFAGYWLDNEKLGDLVIHMETRRLRQGVSVDGAGHLTFDLPERMRHYGDGSGAYYVRVRTEAGATLFSNCGTVCRAHLLPLEVNPPDFWLRMLSPDKPLSVAGGHAYDTRAGRVMVEIAILGDPTSVMGQVLVDVIIDHMAAPMGLMLVFVFGATLWSIRRALAPVREAAARADRLDPLAPSSRLDTSGMPAEVAHLAEAVNRAFSRVGALMRSQKLFTAAIAHEIRTPLAALRLELERIADPRARRAEEDVAVLSHVVAQMTALARLEGVDRRVFRTFDPVGLGQEVVETLAPLVYARGRSIDFHDAGAEPVFGYRSLVLDAVRNLVENATTHTPPGTAITVETGPGRRIAVLDTGAGFPEGYATETAIGHVKRPGGIGIGLAIVRRIAELHGGRMEIARAPGGGARVAIVFPESGPPEKDDV
ncbi:sensor histidine kinase [Segnochrobactraceae bacterium EtOH-i3]